MHMGKTTIARDIFAYRLPSYELISIESTNEDGKERAIIHGKNVPILMQGDE
ncbi:MAG: hypothetical protein ACWIPH_10365 [Ostreibacterium sp.]